MGVRDEAATQPREAVTAQETAGQSRGDGTSRYVADVYVARVCGAGRHPSCWSRCDDAVRHCGELVASS